MKNLFFAFAFVFSLSFAGNATPENTENALIRYCTTLTTSCGPSGDVCGGTIFELARNAAWAENYWCGD
jgi:hypothetical protein